MVHNLWVVHKHPVLAAATQLDARFVWQVEDVAGVAAGAFVVPPAVFLGGKLAVCAGPGVLVTGLPCRMGDADKNGASCCSGEAGEAGQAGTARGCKVARGRSYAYRTDETLRTKSTSCAHTQRQLRLDSPLLTASAVQHTPSRPQSAFPRAEHTPAPGLDGRTKRMPQCAVTGLRV